MKSFQSHNHGRRLAPLVVWGGGVHAGRLTRERRHEYVFAYAPDAPGNAQVSLTMPVQLASWQSRDLHPIFGERLMTGREQFFATLVLSVMLRNGDAHLKNFGVLYPSLAGPFSLAPVYDVVTTAVYLRNDVPALTLEGTKKWWPRRTLERFARSHLSLPAGTIRETFLRTADAVAGARRLMAKHMAEHPEFREVGEAMLIAWDQGVAGIAA